MYLCIYVQHTKDDKSITPIVHTWGFHYRNCGGRGGGLLIIGLMCGVDVGEAFYE
jgi:hypothetical protein